MPSEASTKQARAIFNSGLPNRVRCLAPEDMYESLVLHIALALDEAKGVPEGHVRLPDGRCVRVLGKFTMTKDDAIALEDSPVYHPAQITPGPLHVIEGEVDVPTKRGADNFICQSFRADPSECFSTKQAAQEAGNK